MANKAEIEGGYCKHYTPLEEACGACVDERLNKEEDLGTFLEGIRLERKRIHDLAKEMKSSQKGAQARGWNDALDEIIYTTKDDE